MKLIDAIFQAPDMPENSVICARAPFHQSSEAVIVQFEDDLSIPAGILEQGYGYFLAADEVTELLAMMKEKRSSRETKAEFVCYYASWDAYPAFFDDLEVQPT